MYLLGECDAEGLERLRTRLDELGDSVAIAASGAGLRSPAGRARPDVDRHSVHVHTDDAGAAVEAGLAAGAVSRIQISVLTTRPGRLAPGGWSRERAVLAVVDGDGAEELFRQEGAFVVRPDAATADPANGVSARQLLRAIVDTGAAQVMVLPNGYVAAEELVAGCTGGDRLGNRRGRAACGLDGPGPGGAGCPRPRSSGRRRRIHDGPRGGRSPARFGPRGHRAGTDAGLAPANPATDWESPVTRSWWWVTTSPPRAPG